MSRRKRYRGAGDRRDGRSFSSWPHECGTHESFYRLSLKARALLFELMTQYKGNNNGDLCCAWGLMKDRGWNSRDTVDKARDELLAIGWIVLTRQGGRNSPNLYALTFYDIDECGGKLDSTAPIGKRLSYWKLGHNPDLQGSRKEVA